MIQFTGINWGNEIDDYMGSRMRSLAKMIQASPATSRVVVVGGSEGAWYPAAALIYELEPDVTVVTFDRERDLDHLDRMIAKYEYVWIVCAEDCSVQSPENEFLNGLLRFGFYKQLSYYPEHHAVLLRNSGIVRTT